MTWGSVSSTWPLSQTSMTPSMLGTRRWAVCALKIPPWGIYFISDPDGYWIEIVPVKD